MDKILNFVALRPAKRGGLTSLMLSDSSYFQRELVDATAGPNPQADAVTTAKSFVESGRFLREAAEVSHGSEFMTLYEWLADDLPRRTPEEIEAKVREVTGNSKPSEWMEDVARARDSVLAGYLLDAAGPSATTALKLVRTYGVIEAVLKGGASLTQLASLLHAPLVLPEFLLDLREKAVSDVKSPRQSPDDVAIALLKQFEAVRDLHLRLSQTLIEIASHDEGELVLREFGEQRPLSSLYRTQGVADVIRREQIEPKPQKKFDVADTIVGASTLRRAASRLNVVFSDTALRLLSEPARKTLREMDLDPAVATVHLMESRVTSAYEQATRNLRDLAIQLSRLVS